MSETPETKQPNPKRRWRPRFSLLTLVLGVVFVGACGGLWWRWEPWTCDIALKHEDTIQNAIFSKDGRQVITSSNADTVCVWDLKTGRQSSTQKRTDTDPWSTNYSWRNITWSRGMMDDGGLWLSDEETGEPILRLIADSDDVWRAAFSDSRRRVATANGRYYARIWDGESGCELTRLSGHGNMVLSVAFCPTDEFRVVITDSDSTARVWSRRRPEYWWGIAWLPEFWIALLSGGALLAIAVRNQRKRGVGQGVAG